MSTASSLPYGVNDTAVRTTLSNNITSTDTSVDVGEVTNAPATPFLIAVWVDQSPLREDQMELMEVTSISGTTLTVNRAQKGTSARSFDSGDSVFMGVLPSDVFDLLNKTKLEIRDAAGTREIRSALNDLAFSVAELQFNANLSRLGYQGGVYHVFEDKREVKSYTNGLLFNGSIGPSLEPIDTTPTNKLSDPGDRLWAVSFGPNERIAVGSQDDSVYLYDANGNLLSQLSGGDTVRGVAIGPNQRVAIGNIDDETKVFEEDGSNLPTFLSEPSDWVLAVSFGPNGGLVSASRDGNAYVYDQSLNLTNTLTDPNDSVYAAEINANGRIVIGSQDDNAYVYDSSLNLLDTLRDAEGTVRGVSVDSSGRVAVGSIDDKVYVYDQNLNLVNTLASLGGTAYGVEFGPNGRLAVGSGGGEAHVYNPSLTGRTSISDVTGAAQSVALGSDYRFAVAGEDGIGYIYDSPVLNPMNVVLEKFDLADSGFSGPPVDAVITHDFVPDSDGSQEITYTLSDQSGNSVTFGRSQVGDIVDVSPLQDTAIEVQVSITDSDLNALLNSFAIHFNE